MKDWIAMIQRFAAWKFSLPKTYMMLEGCRFGVTPVIPAMSIVAMKNRGILLAVIKRRAKSAAKKVNARMIQAVMVPNLSSIHPILRQLQRG
jgi:hypothetical protein